MYVSKEDQELMNIVNNSNDKSSMVTKKSFVSKSIESSNQFKTVGTNQLSNMKIKRQSLNGTVKIKKRNNLKGIIKSGIGIVTLSAIIISSISGFKKDSYDDSKDDTFTIVSTLQSDDDVLRKPDNSYSENSINDNSSLDTSEIEKDLKIEDELKNEQDDTLINKSKQMNNNGLEDKCANLKDYFNDNLKGEVQEVGTAININEVKDYLYNSYEGELIKKYCYRYGVDPILITAIAYGESGGSHEKNDYCATGLTGREKFGDDPDTVIKTIYVYNYEDNKLDKVVFTNGGAYDLETNIMYAVTDYAYKMCHGEAIGNMYAAEFKYNLGDGGFSNFYDYYEDDIKGIGDKGFLPAINNYSSYYQTGTGDYSTRLSKLCIDDVVVNNCMNVKITQRRSTGETLKIEEIPGYNYEIGDNFFNYYQDCIKDNNSHKML